MVGRTRESPCLRTHAQRVAHQRNGAQDRDGEQRRAEPATSLEELRSGWMHREEDPEARGDDQRRDEGSGPGDAGAVIRFGWKSWMMTNPIRLVCVTRALPRGHRRPHLPKDGARDQLTLGWLYRTTLSPCSRRPSTRSWGASVSPT